MKKKKLPAAKSKAVCSAAIDALRSLDDSDGFNRGYIDKRNWAQNLFDKSFLGPVHSAVLVQFSSEVMINQTGLQRFFSCALFYWMAL